MKETPENRNDIRKLLLDQMSLIKQESKKNPDKLVELTHALCEVVNTALKI